jgi:hypothetical protein
MLFAKGVCGRFAYLRGAVLVIGIPVCREAI